MGPIARLFRIGESSAVVSMALQEQRAAQAEVEILKESVADLQLAMEDAGWQRLAADGEREFTRDGLGTVARTARVMAVSHPLIKRGLNLRQAYVFGQGVAVQARATGETTGQQDVNTVIQAFWGDEGNRAALTGDQAQEQLERALGTDGNVFLACFTSPLTGRVQVRSVPFDEVVEVLTNPEDRKDPWFYRRQWTTRGMNEQGRLITTIRTDYYPALGYYPRSRPKFIEGRPVHWDSPVYHVKVNHLDGWLFGIGDAYAALAWARAYKDFLADWAVLVKSLSQFAWRATTNGSKAQKLRQALARRPTGTPPAGNENTVGATAVTGPDVTLEAIPKTGATIDSESGRPLATMIAAALDVPVTTLLSDPGQTGARAVAETLNLPTRLAMQQRQTVWAETYRAVLAHVILQAVKAPRGPLKGTISRDEMTDRERVTLTGDNDGDDTTIEVVFPSLDDTPVSALIEAIAKADGTGKMPPVETLKLLLHALGVRDADEIVDAATDDDGRWIDPLVTAGQAAVDAYRRGEDPAAVV